MWRCRWITPAASGSASTVTWRWPSRDTARRDARRRCPWHRRRTVRAAGGPLATARNRRSQRAAPRRHRGLRRTDRTAGDQRLDPFQISTAAVRAVEPGGGISTAPNLLHLLKQATAVADRTEQPSDRAEQAGAPTRPSRYHARPGRPRHASAPLRRRRRIRPATHSVAATCSSAWAWAPPSSPWPWLFWRRFSGESSAIRTVDSKAIGSA